jgi:hypothetical protein
MTRNRAAHAMLLRFDMRPAVGAWHGIYGPSNVIGLCAIVRDVRLTCFISLSPDNDGRYTGLGNVQISFQQSFLVAGNGTAHTVLSGIYMTPFFIRGALPALSSL